MSLTKEEELELLDLLEEEEKAISREQHIEFMEYCWQKNKKTTPFIRGFHTIKICERIDQAFTDYRNGKSTFLLINVHHRTGKSDITSRFLGAHFLGEFPNREVMQASYKKQLAAKFSSYGRKILRSKQYKELYPNVELSKESNAKDYWEIKDTEEEQSEGSLFASGLTSGITGSGYDIGILDDYCSGRADAESLVMRDNTWDCFTNDYLTRKAPVSITIILATQWHWDDLTGRIKKKMVEDPLFPKFDLLTFPAKAEDYTGPGKYPEEYLFMERFSKEWYKAEYAILGRYGAAALLDCNAVLRTGGILSTDGIIVHDDIDKDPNFPSLTDTRWARVWDLAHTAKQRQKDDPDYTSGTKLAFRVIEGDPIPHLYIRDVRRLRKGATDRDKFIKMISDLDGRFVVQAVENSLDNKDAYEYLRKSIPAVPWIKIPVKGDKLVRATPLERIFEAPGHVHIARGAWNEKWIDEVLKFDGLGTTHDDQVDNLSAGHEYFFHGLHLEDKHKEQIRKRRQQK